MATIVALTPNGGTHTGTVFPSGTVAQVLGDNDDQTWVSHGSSGSANLLMDNYTLATDERCAGARAYWVGDAPNSFTAAFGLALTGHPGFDTETLPTIVPGGGTQTRTRRTTWQQGPGTNGELDQTAIDDSRVVLTWTALAGNLLVFRSREVRLELNILKAPIASISSVVRGIVNGIPSVTVAWAYVGNGEAQSRYRVRLFEASIFNSPGFDPDVDTPSADSGWVNSSSSSHTFNGLAFNTTYYAIVSVSKNFNGSPWDSSWSSGIEVTTYSQPIVDVLQPTGTVTESSPDISWSFTDPEGGGQSRFRVAVYQRPGASWAGFNPDTATPLWSREYPGLLTTWPDAGPFSNALNLRAYVRAAKVVMPGNHTVWSEWDYSEFVTSFPQPPAPAIVATEQGDKVSILVTPDSGGVVPDSFDVLRSLDGGNTWEFFRTGDGNTSEDRNPGSKSPFTVVDHEPLLGKPMQYKARSMTTSSGFEVNSPDSNIEVVTPSSKVVWLKNPMDATDNRHFMVSDTWLDTSIRRARTIFEPLGRSLPVVIKGEARQETFTINFLVITEADMNALRKLILLDRPLYVQTPKGSWFAEVAEDVNVRPHLWDDLRDEEDIYQVSVSFIEVDYGQ